jgi:hypothetical protein
MDERPLLSIVVIDVQNRFLTKLTIESILNQQDKRYEIILLTPDSKIPLFKNSKNKIKVFQLKQSDKISQVRNFAMKLVNGKYVHFLFPGEIYLSKFSLSYAFKEIEKQGYPDLLCFAYIKRDLISPSEVKQVSFNLSFLGGERFPIFLRNSFVSLDTTMKIGGFDERYYKLEGFDLISRIFLNKKYRAVSLRNVIVDYELLKYHPKEMLKFLADMIAIIYRQYGFFRLFHFLVIKEMFDFFLYFLKDLKCHFVQKE